ncbi:serine hydrolase domain-containing protein [Nocardiopsis sp. CT-R113]|uniref:Serine hydrolase domain-containing protein n=1 Tax=Nocardiopsis codii TaxID=3065942 RepID=A0ABU7KB48_9ACTN|nr:serine hydrolase domain-containing protein [Nocardiopsis sp. CT-R113]MEE2039134.1 serine hydrolase domain-containing protein [Nocardiopsis sp. CT-R113]
MHHVPRALPLLAAPLLIAAALLPGAVPAAAASGAAPGAPAAEPVPLTPESAQEFVDTRVAELLEEHGAPGVAVTVVGGGEQLASASHGYSDLAERTPLDHTAQTFPLASVSKSLTAAAVLTLVDSGEIDLDEDVNTYLPGDAQLSTDGITMHHLLTHTAGFEELVDIPPADDTAAHLTLDEVVRTSDPESLHEPGRFPGYSNHGSGLAGFIAQEVSGVPFDEFVEQAVLAPLGMEGSGFVQVHEARETFDLPTFHLADGSVAGDLHVSATPAGAALATTDDMARFMLALLGGGELDGERVLPASVPALMTDRQFEVHPDLTSVGYGTYQWRGGDSPVIGHGGDLVGMHTAYTLIPAIDAGVFVAVNGADTAPEAQANPMKDLRMEVASAFSETFDPQDPPTGEADPAADLGAYAGSYISSRRAGSGPAQLSVLLGTMVVRDAGDGSLSINGGMALDDRWLPAGDGRFVAENGEDELVFLEEDGEVVALATDSNPTQVSERTAFLDNPLVHGVAAAASLLILFTAFVQFSRARDRFTVVARVLGSLTALACYVAVGVLAYGMFVETSKLEEWILGGSLLLTAPLAVAVPLTVATAAVAVSAWVRGRLTAAGRVHLSLVVAAAAVFLLVGAQYGFVWGLS